MTPSPFYNEYHIAIVQCRYWYARVGTLPRWRWLARRKALANAQVWGAEAKRIHGSR